MTALRTVGLLDGAVAAVIWLLAAVVVVVVGRGVRRRAAARAVAAPAVAARGHRPSRWPLPLTVLLAVAGLVLVGTGGPGEVQAALARMGWGVSLCSVLGLVVPAAVRGVRGVAVLWLGSVSFTMLGLHVLRFEESVVHANYLYWDRYLVSEYLPTAFVLAAVGLAGLAHAVAESGAVDRRVATIRGRAVVAVAGAATVALVVSWVPRLELQQEHGLYDGSLEFVEDLDAALPPDVPVVWFSAEPSAGVPMVFPNSSWSFGSPLEDTLGRDLLNRPSQSDAFRQDVPLTGPEAELAASCSPGGRVGVVVWWPSGAEIDLPARQDLSWRRTGQAQALMPVLTQGIGPQAWREIPLRAATYELTKLDWQERDCPALR